jgi:hypothetical protein
MTGQPKKFTRRIEDFKCEKCGAKNVGTGFTNHCCECLWSKHIDINPGDRAANCGGMMEPVKIDFEKGKYIINHKCIKCGFQKRKGLEKNDNFETAVAITKKNAK